MNPAHFQAQMQRLITRFGQRNFDPEFVRLVWQAVCGMSDTGFQRLCDVLIGSRSQSKPPLLSEFREAFHNEQKLRFQNDLKGAASFFKRQAPEEMRQHLRVVLSQEYGGVGGVGEALEVARLRQQTKGAK